MAAQTRVRRTFRRTRAERPGLLVWRHAGRGPSPPFSWDRRRELKELLLVSTLVIAATLCFWQWGTTGRPHAQLVFVEANAH